MPAVPSVPIPGNYLPGQNRPLKVLFLSSDTGGGHRASAEALAKQFLIQFPGSTYNLVDLWTDHGVRPYRTLVNSYKKALQRPDTYWKLIYHTSNFKLSEVITNIHCRLSNWGRLKRKIMEEDPDVIVSVHPTMNHTPLAITRSLKKKIPFFTVVTDLGSGHAMWFERRVDALYVASDRLVRLARRRGGTPMQQIVKTGLPIRHDFGEQALRLGDRTSPEGKEYQREVRERILGEEVTQRSGPVILVMSGGEGVGGSIERIVQALVRKWTLAGEDATIYVICGRNEALLSKVQSHDWSQLDAVLVLEPTKTHDHPGALAKLSYNLRKRIQLLADKLWSLIPSSVTTRWENWVQSRIKKVPQPTCSTASTSTDIEEDDLSINNEQSGGNSRRGDVKVIALGFVTNMADYMVAADLLVTKAGPGTIAEAASLGLPLLLTSFLPGQEAGNVAVVEESGFGKMEQKASRIASTSLEWWRHPDKLQQMSLAAQKVGNPDAAHDIVADIGRRVILACTEDTIPPAGNVE
eukprot:Nitzschia sp. Nitz4//scaffold89_size161592//63297//64865//NITZ4_002376-RA/size161592-processed-gene-0.12-mRNA-1//1//CDS//3329559610//7033//frame0